MTTKQLFLTIGVMAAVSFLPRVLPLALFQKKIKNQFIRSFLLYMPYGILAGMVFPDILFSTAGVLSALFGLAVAFFLSWKGMGLFPVALGAVLTVYLAERVLFLISGF